MVSRKGRWVVAETEGVRFDSSLTVSFPIKRSVIRGTQTNHVYRK